MIPSTSGPPTAAVALPPRTLRPRFEQPPPLGLYLHLPWCLRKCPYCDFNSHERAGELAAIDRHLGGARGGGHASQCGLSIRNGPPV